MSSSGKYIALMCSFTGGYPGVHLRTIDSPGEMTAAVLRTSIRLGFPIAVKLGGKNEFEFYAIKP